MREESLTLTDKLLNFIQTYNDWNSNQSETYETAFNRLALDMFKFQFKHNLPYKKFCQSKRRTPLTVKRWLDIPPMPIQGFKELTLTCEPVEAAEGVFMTSGTTNPEKKGCHYHPRFTTWDASMKGPYKQFVLPDREKITTFVLSPAADRNQHSSLSRYLSKSVEYFGTGKSQFFFNENGLDMEGFVSALRASEESKDPVLLIGATFSYVHILDYCRAHGLKFSLPIKSRIFDTGGFKGQSREVEMEQLYEDFHSFFDVPREWCINMYGMTELCSQAYDQTIRTNLLSGQSIRDKAGPAWFRTLVLDPNKLEPVEKGQKGVLAHFDLANWNSCLAILTEDLGYQTDNGFVLLGRVEGSEARGCSIAVDQLLQANK
ncbi:CoF synthetase [Pullulanibacillus sp. KACC 23026]|uniref:LuxE/PaaK family acyltransferase n=1 Tax=Pullulanibacillus sp. KACC 23026 TaxID=3028315 RepID=UPI0023AF1B1C|nr:CoF synthetase [Pullulanibacillus sp. KACC 23026]WEG14641.1 CoF synthetase [Pullulanibacillus sp. KACC 23026]